MRPRDRVVHRPRHDSGRRYRRAATKLGRLGVVLFVQVFESLRPQLREDGLTRELLPLELGVLAVKLRVSVLLLAHFLLEAVVRRLQGAERGQRFLELRRLAGGVRAERLRTG